MPIEAAGFAPLFALAEFLAHKEEFFAGVRVLIAIKQTEVGELLPKIARHFVQQRVFAMDDFIVGKGQNEIFAEGVDERKRDFYCRRSYFLKRLVILMKSMFLRLALTSKLFHNPV